MLWGMSIGSIFSAIGHFFASLFGADGSIAQKVLHGVASFVNLAAPIVAEIETTVKGLPQSNVTEAVTKFLSKYDADAAKVQATANSLLALAPADLYHQLAVFALGTLVPAGTASSALNLAVELAYSIFKNKQAQKASQTK